MAIAAELATTFYPNLHEILDPTPFTSHLPPVYETHPTHDP